MIVAGRSLADWLDYQQRIHPRTIDFTLDRIRVVLGRLGLARPRVPVLTVGGTNGKGSVTALIESVLRAGGRRTGLYTSPHLIRYQERIRVDGREIDEPALLAAFERVEAARGDEQLTFFEYATAAALVAFEQARVDVLVLEVGLGGRLDAVNALAADVAVVVSIGLDHCEYLGDTLDAIAREKAGIFRAGRPAIYGSAAMPAAIAECAAALGAPLARYGAEFGATATGDDWTWWCGERRLAGLPRPALAGQVQLANTATALAALAAVDLLPERAAIERGLSAVVLAGRFQVAPGPVEWVFDVAHNEDSARVLGDNLRARPVAGRTHVVFGVLRDKDVHAIVRGVHAALDDADRWCAVTLAGERGLAADALAERLAPLLGRPPETAASVEAGCERAAARARPGDRVLVFGSFHTVGPALEWHRLYSRPSR